MSKGYPYSDEESLFIENHLPDHSYRAVAELCNHKFHNNEKTRTMDSIRGLARRRGVNITNNRYRTVTKGVNNLPDFVIDKPAPSLQPVEDLIAERILKYEILAESKKSCIDIHINHDLPIGIAHFGDPHVDDDGTNLRQLYDHVKLVNDTDGLFGANIGDNTNNWVGRLQRLYGSQSTSSKEAWQICEHFIKSVDWLYLIGGNHDAWSGSGDPLKWICGDSLYTKHGQRMKLIFPNGKEVFINARHQWRGNSMWNTAHSISKSAQMGMDDHVLVGGHTHVSGYQVVKNPNSGRISHCVQVASYKHFDKYAEEKGFEDKDIFNCPVTVINPHAETELELVHTIFDPKVASEFLTHIRSKYE